MSLKYIPVLVVILFIVYLAGLSFVHRNTVLKSAKDRQLSPCPQKPNCVFSAADDAQHRIDAFKLLDNDAEKSWQRLIAAIKSSGGEIIIDDGEYCHAVFTSTLFRFKDDVEARLNKTDISIRSASRAGTSDLGANRKRVEHIRSRYLAENGD